MGISSSFISVVERLRAAVWRVSAAVSLMGLLLVGGAIAAQAQPATEDVAAYLETGEARDSELIQGFSGAAVTGFGAPHVIHTFHGEFFGSRGTTPDPVVASEEFLAVAFAGDVAVGVVRIGGEGDEVAIVAAEDGTDLASALATRELASANSPLVLVADPRGEGWLVLEDGELTPSCDAQDLLPGGILRACGTQRRRLRARSVRLHPGPASARQYCCRDPGGLSRTADCEAPESTTVLIKARKPRTVA